MLRDMHTVCARYAPRAREGRRLRRVDINPFGIFDMKHIRQRRYASRYGASHRKWYALDMLAKASE